MRGSGSETGERLHRAYIPGGEGRRNHCFPAAPAPEPRTQPLFLNSQSQRQPQEEPGVGVGSHWHSVACFKVDRLSFTTLKLLSNDYLKFPIVA